jgi:6-phosphofructokinase 1
LAQALTLSALIIEVGGIMKGIAVMTSGGDAAEMDAAIRAIVRTAVARKWEVFGIRRGYAGLLAEDFLPLRARNVGGIIQSGGTILGSARYLEFKQESVQKKTLAILRHHEIDTLIVIGGNGSQKGANALSQLGFPVVGIASTINNDLYNADITMGVDTALNIAREAIDRLKVTASSHKRGFLVEVMGRHSGYLALMTGIAVGAEAIIIPEIETNPEDLAHEINRAYSLGKAHAIIVVAEGATYNAEGLARYFKEHQERIGFDLRVTVTGHVQRGGEPGVFDRLLATRLGAAAVEYLANGKYGVLLGLINGKIEPTPLAEVATRTKQLDTSLFALAQVLNS